VGIATGVHYPIPVHEQPAYQHLVSAPESLPVTHELCKRILSLPMHPTITRAQVERVSEALREALASGM
jgi:dTDP-4-amino-4,6-dideoxygalactose transaminase